MVVIAVDAPVVFWVVAVVGSDVTALEVAVVLGVVVLDVLAITIEPIVCRNDFAGLETLLETVATVVGIAGVVVAQPSSRTSTARMK